MKITFLLPGPGRVPVGGMKIVYEYANRLTQRGHIINIIQSDGFFKNFPLFEKIKRRIRYFQRKMDKSYRPDRWFKLNPRINILWAPSLDEKYIPSGDCIIATAWQTAEFASGYSPEKGEKFYLIQHYEVWNGPKDRIDATWRKLSHKIVIARWLYDKGIELGISPGEIIHIPNGIDHAFFRLINPVEIRLPRIAMLYLDLEWKGGGDGVKALELVKKEFPHIQAVLFGVEPRPRRVPRWIEYVCNPHQSILVKEIYNKASIYLCPSWTEGWHLPPAEAMACGCAVVSTNIGGVRDYVINGKTALLSPVKNPALLAKNLMYLLKDDNLRISLARAGYNYIRQFNWEYSTDLLERFLLYRNLNNSDTIT